MAEEWMEEYLIKYGLHDWSYAISYQDRDKWLGLCDHYHRCIILHYLHILESQETDILDTIWHEIAHALTPDDSISYPKTAGHGLIWIRKAQELGVSAKQLKYYQEKLAIA